MLFFLFSSLFLSFLGDDDYADFIVLDEVDYNDIVQYRTGLRDGIDGDMINGLHIHNDNENDKNIDGDVDNNEYNNDNNDSDNNGNSNNDNNNGGDINNNLDEINGNEGIRKRSNMTIYKNKHHHHGHRFYQNNSKKNDDNIINDESNMERKKSIQMMVDTIHSPNLSSNSLINMNSITNIKNNRIINEKWMSKINGADNGRPLMFRVGSTCMTMSNLVNENRERSSPRDSEKNRK